MVSVSWLNFGWHVDIPLTLLPAVCESSSSSTIRCFKVLFIDINIWMICVSASIVYFFLLLINYIFVPLYLSSYVSLHTDMVYKKHRDFRRCDLTNSFFLLFNRWGWRMIISIQWKIELGWGWWSILQVLIYLWFMPTFDMWVLIENLVDLCIFNREKPWRFCSALWSFQLSRLCPRGVSNAGKCNEAGAGLALCLRQALASWGAFAF